MITNIINSGKLVTTQLQIAENNNWSQRNQYKCIIYNDNNLLLKDLYYLIKYLIKQLLFYL